MNLNKKHIQKNLISNLNNINVERLSTNEINFFKNKKILITGVSGIIGINLLFFFNKLNVGRKTSIHIDGTYNTSLFNFYWYKRWIPRFKNGILNTSTMKQTMTKFDIKIAEFTVIFVKD